MRARVCRECGADFATWSFNHFYCSKRCRCRSAQRTYREKKKRERLDDSVMGRRLAELMARQQADRKPRRTIEED